MEYNRDDLTVDEKRKIFLFFQKIDYDKSIRLDKVNNIRKFRKVIDDINCSIFINDFFIEVDDEVCVKRLNKYWYCDFLLFIDQLNYNTTVNIDLFMNKELTINTIKLISNKYYPDFNLIIEPKLDGQNDYLIKKKVNNYIDDRDLSEFLFDYNGIVFDYQNINKQSILNLKNDIEKYNDDREKFFLSILSIPVYLTLSNNLITEYYEKLDDFYLNNHGYNGWVILVFIKLTIKKSKKGSDYYVCSVEDMDGIHELVFFDNVFKFPLSQHTVYAFNCDVVEYNNRYTKIKEKKIHINSYELLKSKEILKNNKISRK